MFTEMPFVKISIEKTDTELEVEAGHKTFYMEASYEYYPDANISWTKDAEPIDTEDRHYLIRFDPPKLYSCFISSRDRKHNIKHCANGVCRFVLYHVHHQSSSLGHLHYA